MLQKAITLTLLFLLPTIILAHGSHGNGILAGFTHPIFGIDHNVAIVGSGILGYLLDQRKWYLVSFAFVLTMIIGGFIGVNNDATIFIEKIISFSVFSIGFMIAFRVKLNFTITLLVIGIFGYFHGYAHGAEMSETNSVFKYIPGYTLGALLLAIVGVLIGKLTYAQGKINSCIPIVSGIIIGCGIMMVLS